MWATRVEPPVVPEPNTAPRKATRGWLATNLGWWGECLEATLESRYMRANVVYLLYTAIILHINMSMYPRALSLYSDDEYYYVDYNASDTQYAASTRGINALYVAAAVIHLINALQYIYVWFPLGYGLFTWVMVPEFLNIIGACLYLYTATLYDLTGTLESPTTLAVHRLETAASGIEIFAAFGWVLSWWYTFPRGRGRGITFDDPDFWGNVFIVVPSIIYFAYNLQLIKDPGGYGTNLLYEKADILYFVGALTYVLAAMRDDGFFPDFRIFATLSYYSGLTFVAGKVGGVFGCHETAAGGEEGRSRGCLGRWRGGDSSDTGSVGSRHEARSLLS